LLANRSLARERSRGLPARGRAAGGCSTEGSGRLLQVRCCKSLSAVAVCRRLGPAASAQERCELACFKGVSSRRLACRRVWSAPRAVGSGERVLSWSWQLQLGAKGPLGAPSSALRAAWRCWCSCKTGRSCSELPPSSFSRRRAGHQASRQVRAGRVAASVASSWSELRPKLSPGRCRAAAGLCRRDHSRRCASSSSPSRVTARQRPVRVGRWPRRQRPGCPAKRAETRRRRWAQSGSGSQRAAPPGHATSQPRLLPPRPAPGPLQAVPLCRR